ncbi:family 43 glycosylhydrolase [Microbacterium sp.]|uniref:family 43 glycosylhydrolase n=1 Tax=Microbacterium sp. TaxID=51671 RepID=UPI0027377AF6|nr:family 43 glycosylhydrolase [Microbacterium sp.]MDP3952830.1 family 43 glycosylhydrolase [Microbacterium sp.]
MSLFAATTAAAETTEASETPPLPVDIESSGQLSLSGDLNLHDPTVWKAGDTYFAAPSHRGIWTAPALEGPWENIGSVPTASWAGGGLWAPHVQQIGDTTYFYYSTSAFGTNNSAIGLKTTQTPHIPSSYVDHGEAIVSSGTRSPERNTFNAIDPALEKDDQGNWWMVWGSHFDGIFIQQLDDDMVTVVGEPRMVAHRASDRFPVDNPNFNRIEGPSVFKHGEWYYLLTAWDWCCRASGNDNTYKIVAGRSKDIAGPYLDKNGVDLAEGGGTIILNSREAQEGVTPEGLYRSPGAPDYFWDEGTLYLIYHAHRPGTTMGIRPLDWDDGWPFLHEPGGGAYDIQDGALYQLRLQAGTLSDADSLQNPVPSENCLSTGGDEPRLATCAESNEQYFELQRHGDGFYAWRSLDGAKDQCLTMSSTSGDTGTPVVLTACDGSDGQLWYFDDTGHGFHRLVGKVSNLALEVDDDEGTVGSAIVGDYRRDGDHQAGNLTQAGKWPPQQWRLEMTHDTTAPTFTASLDQRQRIVVEATDDKSGVERVEYAVTKKNHAEKVWEVLDGPLRVDAASEVNIRAIDVVGNVSEELVTSKKDLR